MPACAVGDLVGGGEMQKAVAPIVRRAVVATGPHRRLPCLGRTHVIDHSGHATRLPQSALPAKRPGATRADGRIDRRSCGTRRVLLDATPPQVLVPRVAALMAGFREIVWLSPDGEVQSLSP